MEQTVVSNTNPDGMIRVKLVHLRLESSQFCLSFNLTVHQRYLSLLLLSHM